MERSTRWTRPRFRVTQGERLLELPQVRRLPAGLRRDIRVVCQVLPFRLNDYVLEKLIDWEQVPDDPIYRLTFPHRDMLDPHDYATIARLLDRGSPASHVQAAANRIRRRLNPHPGGQLERNVPRRGSLQLHGLQHKYKETVLCFPAQGQTCHSFCGYCFRWAQFVGMSELKQALSQPAVLVDYLRHQRCVTDVLFTGGDPLVMSTSVLARYVEPLLAPALEHIRTIRIGTKALSYWPFRFLSADEGDSFLRLIERCVRHGKHVAIMAHFTHGRELETNAVERALRRLKNAGAVIRTQSPIVRHVNDTVRAWRAMWNTQIRLGLIPYYMFVERDTGARRYYSVPLAKAFEVFRAAWRSLSGLARTVRGPSMSATPGKVVVDGVTEIAGERVFALRFLQARNPEWVGRPFFARYDETAEWFDDLRPAFGDTGFFHERDPVSDWRELDRGPGGSQCVGDDAFSPVDAYGEDSFS